MIDMWIVVDIFLLCVMMESNGGMSSLKSEYGYGVIYRHGHMEGVMKVRELIKLLSKINGELDIITALDFTDRDSEYYEITDVWCDDELPVVVLGPME